MNMIPLKNTEKGSKRDLGTRYTKAIDRHAQLEKELTRVMNRWQKSRAELKRIEKKMDEAQAAMWDANAAYNEDSI